MDHEMIITEQHGRVGVIKFNRPDKLNSLHAKMSAEARGQIEAWNVDRSIGAIVLTGEGRAFCAGADMGGWQRQIERREGATTESAPRHGHGPLARIAGRRCGSDRSRPSARSTARRSARA